MRFCTWRVKTVSTGSTRSNSSASPVFLTAMTAKIEIRRQTSAAIEITPEVNSASTVSTSPTNRDTSVPGSCSAAQSVVRRVNLSIRLLRRACVIFCPNTVSSPSLADSIIPASASMAK